MMMWWWGLKNILKLQLMKYIDRWLGFPGGASGKEPTCHFRRLKRHRFNPCSGRSPGGGHSNPLQHSCLENPMDRGAWWATVHTITQSQAQLRWFSTPTFILLCLTWFYIYIYIYFFFSFFFLQIEVLWQTCIKQIYQCHFSKSHFLN